MKYKVLEAQVKELRTLYPTLTEEDKQKVAEEGKEKRRLLEENFGCYQCDELVSKEQLNVPNTFCSEECKKKYWVASYDTPKESRRMTIDEMKAQLLKMAKEERLKSIGK